jgi:glycosyltransferase involved in cell wall biosynthesis
MKLACVIHRYGPEIAGGSESHCRAIAEQLAARHDVTVLTTCADDHITWHNRFPAGESRAGAVRVRRFPVTRTRSLHRFAESSEIVFSGRASEAEQENWFRENGPCAPALVEFIGSEGAAYDWILFWSYRYFTTYFGLPPVRERAILVPTAEEDPLIRVDILGKFFQRPAGFLFLTPEEQALVARRADGQLAPWSIIGSGLEPLRGPSESVTGSLGGVAGPFILYLGRVDPNKGCDTLLRHFMRWSDQTGRRIPLVMAGPANMPLPEHPMVKLLGYVGDERREALLSTAALLVVPSPFESLSMVLLEAWNHGLPALVNGGCRVLKGQVLRADGGLYYRSYAEFAEGLDCLLAHPEVARSLGQQGRAYVDREYRWPRVIGTIETFLESLPRRLATPAAVAG